MKDRPGHDRRYALKCDKMERELGWKPAISLDEGLRQTIDWYEATRNGWQESGRRISLLLREILRESRFFAPRHRAIRVKNRFIDFCHECQAVGKSDKVISLRLGRSLREDIAHVQRIETNLPGVCEFRPKLFAMRAVFSWRHTIATGSPNWASPMPSSRTIIPVPSKGTLRGLHYQLHHPQAKLCRVVEGEALDVAVDIRVGSPHFGKWTSVLLSAKNHNQIYIPRGFAHGFLALTDTVQFLYKCGEFYDLAMSTASYGTIQISRFPGGSPARLFLKKTPAS